MTDSLFDTDAYDRVLPTGNLVGELQALELVESEDCRHKKLTRGKPVDLADTWYCRKCGELVAIRLRYDAETGTYSAAAA